LRALKISKTNPAPCYYLLKKLLAVDVMYEKKIYFINKVVRTGNQEEDVSSYWITLRN
jgi:hypothetical protein